MRGRGRGGLMEGGAYLLFWPEGMGAYSGGGRLLERGRLFEEIRYALVLILQLTLRVALSIFAV